MKKFSIFSLCILLLSSSLFAEESNEALTAKEQTAEIQKISEAFGHLMGKNLETIGVHFDIGAVIKGLQDATAGKDSPMTELECIEAITEAQETSFMKEAEENLSLAEKFLQNNGSLEGIISLEGGKVQYKIDKAGSGEALQESSSPLIRYTGRFLDGQIFGESAEDEPVFLEELIPGLKAALIGMKEGEKRTVYIHPDKAYGLKGSLPPNSLLQFEIEVIKTTPPMMEEPSSDSQESLINPEIASPELMKGSVR